MQRYQIYLNPKSVDVLDNLAGHLDIARSQIIRDIIDKMASVYEKMLNRSAMKNNPLLKMAGFAKGGDPGLSLRVDEIYLKD